MLNRYTKAGCLLVALAPCISAQRMASTYASLQAFVDSCPQNDPNYSVIRRDFEILRDRTPAGPVACTEPYTQMPTSQVTEELAAVQALRFAYYMDMGRAGYLPWTPLRLYDWIKSRVAGINIDTALDPGSVSAFCCSTINGRVYIVESTSPDDTTRIPLKTPQGLAAQVALIAHETRHSEGNGYGHASCCGIPGGCDQNYDETNLSAYGIQYYLSKQWLTGAINLGYSCDPSTRAELANAFVQMASVYPARFCDAKPPMPSLPPAPGGACIAACNLDTSNSPASQINATGGIAMLGVTASTPSCGWTADSAESWIFPASGMNSLGSGVAAFGVDPNPGPSVRTGTLVAGGRTVPVGQAGCAPCTAVVSISSVMSGAPFVSAIAGGSWVTIYGSNLAATTRQWQTADFSGNKLPLSLDGVSVGIDGQPAAVHFVSPTQINVQSPDDSATGSVRVQVSNQQGTAEGTATLERYAPAFFSFGSRYVAAAHADGTFVGPTGLLGDSVTTRPAAPGEIIILFGTGFGPTNPPAGAGVVFTGTAPLAFPDQLQILIGGESAGVQFAGLTGAGLYQFNITIPELPDGDRAVVANINKIASSTNLFIAVQH